MLYNQKKVFLTLCSIFFIVLTIKFLWLLDPLLSKGYDVFNPQKESQTIQKSQFQLLGFEELPKEEQIKYTNKPCKSLSYEAAKFIKITWFERYQKLFGNIKPYQLLTPDRLIANRIKTPNLDKVQYLLVADKVLKAHYELLKEMEFLGLDANEIKVTSGFRNPAYNSLIGGQNVANINLAQL